jgi:hypothetical protein
MEWFYDVANLLAAPVTCVTGFAAIRSLFKKI